MAKLNPGSIHLRMPEELLESLRQIALKQAPPVEAADLLRRAAVAIDRCWKEHGVIPADMEIRQRRIRALLDEATPFGVNESGPLPGPQAVAQAALRKIRKAENEAAAGHRAAHK